MFKAVKLGVAFLAEKILGQVPRHGGHIAVKRFKALPPALPGLQQHDQPEDPDYSYEWAKDPLANIGEQTIIDVINLLDSWAHDIATSNIRPLSDLELLFSDLVGREQAIADFELPVNLQLSRAVHHAMLDRHGSRSSEHWTEAAAELLHGLRQTTATLRKFYSLERLAAMMEMPLGPDGRVDIPDRLCSDRVLAGQAGAFLHILASQSDRYRIFHGSIQEALMKMVADLIAFHQHERVFSFVVATKTGKRAPGYLYSDITEQATTEQLEVHSFPSAQAEAEAPSAATSTVLRGCLRRQPTNGLQTATPTKSQRKRLRFNSPEVIFISPRPELKSDKSADEHVFDDDESDLGYAKRRRMLESEAGTSKAASAGPSDQMAEQKSDPQAWPRFTFADDTDLPRLKMSHTMNEEITNVRETRAKLAETRRRQRSQELRQRELERQRMEAAAAAARRMQHGLRPAAREAIRHLNDEWRRRVLGSVEASPMDALAKTPEGIDLRSKDFKTVVPYREWLNDEIVNASLMHLSNYINQKAGISNPKTQTPKCQALSSFFWSQLCQKGSQAMLRWMRRVGITKENFHDIQTILIPICKSNHWTLVVVRPQARAIAHMDSMRDDGQPEILKIVNDWVAFMAGSDKPTSSDKPAGAWRDVTYEAPRQTNGWDCGVHTVTNAMFVALGVMPAYHDHEMPRQRHFIAGMLLNGGFQGDFDLEGI